MSSERAMLSLGELADIKHGWAFKSDFFSESPKDNPIVVGIGNFKYEGGFRFESTKIKYYEGDFPSDYLLEAGDILLVMTCQTAGGEILGIPGKIPGDNKKYLHNQRLGKFINKRRDLLDDDYAYHLFKSADFNRFLASSASGTKILHTSPDRILQYSLELPPVSKQKVIAHILGTLDDKIELNRKTNETLEAMTKALFKSWFVDFDPVKEKAEGRPTGLPAEVSNLFPDSFEDSELGEIPSGWAMGTIENIAEVIDCLHSKKPDQQEVGKQLLQLNNIEDNGLLNQSQKYFISADDYTKWSSRIEVEQGDCVITNVGRVGAVAQIPKGVKAAMGRNMTAIRTKGISPYPTFLLEYLLSAFGREEIRLNIDEGTILNALNVKNIPRLRFFRSPDSILNAYEKSARPLREAMESSLKENQALSALRDALLPKLISGEIRIPDAEKMLEEVGI